MEAAGLWLWVAAGTVVVGKQLWEVANRKVAKAAWASMYAKPHRSAHQLQPAVFGLPTQEDVKKLLAGQKYSYWLSLEVGDRPATARTLLPPPDVQQCRFVRSFLFLYEQELDLGLLLQGFRDAMREFPHVGGVLQQRFSKEGAKERNGLQEMWVEHSAPRVEFVVVRYDDTTLPEELKGMDIGAASCDAANWQSMSSPINCDSPAALGVPLARIQVTYFDNPLAGAPVRTAVSLFLSHGIGDANSALYFTRFWAAATRKHAGVSSFDEEPLPNMDKSPLAAEPPVAHVTAQRALQVGWRKACSIAVVWRFMRYSWLHAKPCHAVYFYQRVFTCEEVSLLKDHVRRVAGARLKGRVLSTNDVITALFFKWRCLHEKWPSAVDSGVRRLVVICNMRAILGLGSNYYGNCLSFIQKELPVEDVQTMPLAELAILVRTLVESYKAQDATDAVNLMKETYFNHGASGLVALEPPMDYPTSMIVSNWAKFRSYDVDFGQGRPLRFVYPLWIAMPGVNIVNTRVGADGDAVSEWTYTCTSGMQERIQSLSVADILAEETQAGR